MGVGGQRHAQAVLPPGKRPETHCIGGWVVLRAGLDGCRKSLPHRDLIPDHPAHSESLYRLSYPGPPERPKTWHKEEEWEEEEAAEGWGRRRRSKGKKKPQQEGQEEEEKDAGRGGGGGGERRRRKRKKNKKAVSRVLPLKQGKADNFINLCWQCVAVFFNGAFMLTVSACITRSACVLQVCTT